MLPSGPPAAPPLAVARPLAGLAALAARLSLTVPEPLPPDAPLPDAPPPRPAVSENAPCMDPPVALVARCPVWCAVVACDVEQPAAAATAATATRVLSLADGDRVAMRAPRCVSGSNLLVPELERFPLRDVRRLSPADSSQPRRTRSDGAS